jgi:two-component system, OmpR family, sensor histidine kinase KdpD
MAERASRAQRIQGGLARWAWAVIAVLACSGVAWQLVPHDDHANLIMVYLLGIVLVASRYGQGPSVLTSVLSVAAYDFFFVPPIFTFVVNDLRHLFTFAMMLLVALVISSLTARIRRQAEAARERERRTAALYRLSRELTGAASPEALAGAAARHVGEVFDATAFVLLPDASGALKPVGEVAAADVEEDVARAAFDRGVVAGAGAASHGDAKALYVPLAGARGAVGVLGVVPHARAELVKPTRMRQLEAFADQTAVAVERALLAAVAEHAQLETEAERLKSGLLSSVSHDLRTPLGAITGSLSAILDEDGNLDAATQRDLVQTAYDEADRLARLVRDLLDMTKMQAGAPRVAKEWAPLEEIVGSALGRLEGALAARPVEVRIPADLPLVPLDAVLVEQLLVNVLENAVKYTPAESPLEISARSVEDGKARAVEVAIADRGPGVAAGDEEKVFDKFARGAAASGPGAGLGLAICRAIAAAHGGSIRVERREGGGARFVFSLPLDGEPPVVHEEERLS